MQKKKKKRSSTKITTVNITIIINNTLFLNGLNNLDQAKTTNKKSTKSTSQVVNWKEENDLLMLRKPEKEKKEKNLRVQHHFQNYGTPVFN